MVADTPWSLIGPLPFAQPDGHEPALVATPGALHLVWTSGKTLYHSCLIGNDWRPPASFASGEQPCLAVAADGRLYCAFANWFLGNCEIYCCTWDGERWSLPELVSRTTGVSTDPVLAAGPDGILHIAWADTTPGYSAIYYGKRGGVAWLNSPLPNGQGSKPALAVTPAGEIIIAWQDRLASTGCFEVFASVRKGTAWSILEIVSGTPDHHSLYPRLTVSAKGSQHLIWQEERGGKYTVRNAERVAGGWTVPVDVSEIGNDCRLARIAASQGELLQCIWSSGQQLKHRARPGASKTLWWQPEVAFGNAPGISDLALAVAPPAPGTSGGVLHVVWSAYAQTTERRLFYARRQPVTRQMVDIPIVVNETQTEESGS
jgi:hypothetical protein